MPVMVMIASFVVLILATVPISFAMGLATMAGLGVASTAPMLVVTQKIFDGADSFVLLAIPMFVLAGALMETGGISARLVALARALVGHVRGGLGMVVVLAEMLFSGISGSTVADVSAIGSLLVPSMVRAGFKPERAVAIVAASSAMGILVPPCLLMVVVAQVAGLSVGALFLAGCIPAVVLALGIMVLIYVQARRESIAGDRRASLRELGAAARGAVIPLMMPVIIFGSIFGGVADPTEAAVIAVVYAFVVGMFVYKEISWAQLPRILVDSAVTTGVVIFMVGVAAAFSWMLAAQQVPMELARVLKDMSSAPWVFFMASIVVFILLSAVIEGLPALIICMPIFLPVATGFGIDPLHYATVVIAALGVGLFLPPIGVGYYIAASFARASQARMLAAMAPYMLVLIVGLAVLIVFPSITLALPRAFAP